MQRNRQGDKKRDKETGRETGRGTRRDRKRDRQDSVFTAEPACKFYSGTVLRSDLCSPSAVQKYSV